MPPELPEGWSLQRLDRLFEIRSEEPHPEDERVTAYLDGRVTLRSNVAGQKIKGVIKEAGWQRIHAGDVAISGMNAHLGGIGVSDALGKCSPIYLVLKPKEGTNARFIALVLRFLAHAGVLKSLVSTIRFNSADFKKADLKKILVWLPPEQKQVGIVKFLDRAGGLIHRYTRTKQKLIALLSQQKQSITDSAIFDLKAHDTVRLRFLITKLGSGVTPRGGAAVYEGSGVPLLRSQNVHFGELRLEDVAFISAETHDRMRGTHVRPGDVLLNITGASIGRVCCVPHSLREANVNQHVCIIRAKRELCLGEYLALFLSTDVIQREIYLGQNGASREGLPLQAIKSLRVLLPALGVQKNVVGRVAEEISKLRRSVDRISHEIQLAREYTNSLNADLVTGRLDVGDAADRLPERTQDEEPLAEEEDLKEPADELELAAEETEA